ncbi:hypothetical protein CAOG_009350 [Capsaspora owczarzaki ATCC 30864]|uniref:Uncharacterized protein n=1 Tax=Capsaspora owczarzaki (strain ATCC 30864) TaxID=595528 RepID=A0A0D2X0P1_CAPO3|nr:hypothetical protein CAOG_009350 [Capsaspora owczarzaki ATCC 30864]
MAVSRWRARRNPKAKATSAWTCLAVSKTWAGVSWIGKFVPSSWRGSKYPGGWSITYTQPSVLNVEVVRYSIQDWRVNSAGHMGRTQRRNKSAICAASSGEEKCSPSHGWLGGMSTALTGSRTLLEPTVDDEATGVLPIWHGRQTSAMVSLSCVRAASSSYARAGAALSARLLPIGLSARNMFALSASAKERLTEARVEVNGESERLLGPDLPFDDAAATAVKTAMPWPSRMPFVASLAESHSKHFVISETTLPDGDPGPSWPAAAALHSSNCFVFITGRGTGTAIASSSPS